VNFKSMDQILNWFATRFLLFNNSGLVSVDEHFSLNVIKPGIKSCIVDDLVLQNNVTLRFWYLIMNLRGIRIFKYTFAGMTQRKWSLNFVGKGLYQKLGNLNI
jgi:hypothetical protein